MKADGVVSRAQKRTRQIDSDSLREKCTIASRSQVEKSLNKHRAIMVKRKLFPSYLSPGMELVATSVSVAKRFRVHQVCTKNGVQLQKYWGLTSGWRIGLIPQAPCHSLHTLVARSCHAETEQI